MPAIDNKKVVSVAVKIGHALIEKRVAHETDNSIRFRMKFDIQRALETVGIKVDVWDLDIRT